MGYGEVNDVLIPKENVYYLYNMTGFIPDPRLKNLEPPIEFVCEFQGSPDEVHAFYQCLADQDYVAAETFREQVGILCRYLRTDCIRVSHSRIGALFNKKKPAIKKQCDKYIQGKTLNGQPPLLKKNELEIVANDISEMHKKMIYPTYETIQDIIFLNSKKT